MDCRDCKNRQVGCHATCEIYLNWKAEVDKINQARRMYLNNKYVGYHVRRKK